MNNFRHFLQLPRLFIVSLTGHSVQFTYHSYFLITIIIIAASPAPVADYGGPEVGGDPRREADLRGRVDLPSGGVEPGPGRAVHHGVCPEMRGEIRERVRGGHRDSL